MTAPWYTIANVEQLDTPALVVYRERVAENIRRMIAVAGRVARLRPHVKTHKMPAVVRLQMQAGIRKFKCATIAEAEMVAGCGAPDVLLAYPPVGPAAGRLARLAAAFPATRFSSVFDDAGALAALSAAAVEAGASLDVLVDLDVGMHRTGIAPGPAVVELFRRAAALPGLTPTGLHVYDGHLRAGDLAERTRQVAEAFAPVDALRVELAAAGFAAPRIVAGGTPTFPIHARRDDVECSPGTCVFWDDSYQTKFPDLDFVFAALVVTRVISRPTPTRLCTDLGYKAVSPDNPDPRVLLLDLPDARAVVHSEEHLAIETAGTGQFAVGDVLYGVPHHICPTCALYDEAVIVENGRAAERWPITARARKLTI